MLIRMLISRKITVRKITGDILCSKSRSEYMESGYWIGIKNIKISNTASCIGPIKNILIFRCVLLA
jgi:hypothetical protein